ncbi:XRE family transcriptional regulator [Nonomuraea sp. NPDC049784]|uniref:helix-turn-helix domain-containing protein n=1 Tax=Nonomuraea sp. NPDC049784 TaxID=3154361 RepID=UPI0033EDC3EF
MVTPYRITLARRRRELRINELARLLHIHTQTLSNYENGRHQPADEVVDQIAEVLRFPVKFFYLGDVDPIEAEAISFRARSKLAPRRRELARAVGELVVELHKWITGRFRLPEPDLPTLGKPDPETAAVMVRSQWGLGLAPISNMVHLLESHGVRVFSLAPEYEDVDAFSFVRDSTPFVFLNTRKSAERSRFDAAHELGHLILHGEERPVDRPQAEEEAHAFARAFLMPADSVVAHMPPSPFVDQILKGKKIWKVSALALTYRLHDLGVMSDWNYRQACIELGKRGYKTGEPDGAARETSQLLDKVLRALRAKGIGTRQIEHDLAIPAQMVNDFVFGLTIVALAGDGGGPRERSHLRLLEA